MTFPPALPCYPLNIRTIGLGTRLGELAWSTHTAPYRKRGDRMTIKGRFERFTRRIKPTEEHFKEANR
jgi:hypothetical protein